MTTLYEAFGLDPPTVLCKFCLLSIPKYSIETHLLRYHNITPPRRKKPLPDAEKFQRYAAEHPLVKS